MVLSLCVHPPKKNICFCPSSTVLVEMATREKRGQKYQMLKQCCLRTSSNTNFLHMTVLCWLLMVLWHLTWWKEKSTFAGRLPKHPFWMMGTGNSNCFLCHIVSSILEFSIKSFFLNCSALFYQINIHLYCWFGSEMSINC